MKACYVIVFHLNVDIRYFTARGSGIVFVDMGDGEMWRVKEYVLRKYGYLDPDNVTLRYSALSAYSLLFTFSYYHISN